MSDAKCPSSGEILATLETHIEKLRQLGVVKLGLFGSRRRNDAQRESDVDPLVTLARPSFNDYMDIKLYLEEVSGCGVDLVLEKSLRPELRPYILPETQYVKGL